MTKNTQFLSKEEYQKEQEKLIDKLVETNADTKTISTTIWLFQQTTHKKGLFNRIRMYSDEIFGIVLIGWIILCIIVGILYVIDFFYPL